MNRKGFTLTEAVIATAVFSLVSAGAMTVLVVCNKSWRNCDEQIRSMSAANLVLEKMSYGGGGSNGLRGAVRTNVTVTTSGSEWTVNYRTWDSTRFGFSYFPSDTAIAWSNISEGGYVSTISTHIVSSTVTNFTNGLAIMVQVGVRDGRFSATNTASTFIYYRN